MNKQTLFFAASRYWNNPEELQQAYQALVIHMNLEQDQTALVIDGAGIPAKKSDLLVVVPMSGAVQQIIQDTAQKYAQILIYAAYMEGNAPLHLTQKMMEKNAAPTIMDCWAVLRKTHPSVALCLNKEELTEWFQVYQAYDVLQNSKILLIGETEPWVISSSRNLEDYKPFGATVIQLPQSDIVALYESATEEDYKPYYDYFVTDGIKIVEPDQKDLVEASKMVFALKQLTEQHQANGVALACFNLLATGTNMCLAVSYLNDQTPYIAACEGDLDSAITMLFMKHIANTRLWMANPGLHPNGLVNFSHCTAPICISGERQEYQLRNHHESGIGVSLQVDLPINQPITACRISGRFHEMTIHSGTTVAGDYESACRTQIYVKFNDFQHYRETTLGCHQVFAFEDIAKKAQKLASLMKIPIA